jgi:hypothetical protein
VLRQTEIDGVPTVLAPMAGPLNAGLVFRVGRADETLARSGITHLVEHLALYQHGLSDYHYNGATGPVFTHFHVSGSEADVVGYLTGVCAALNDLPVGRLETEKAILRTEEHNRSFGANHSMPLWRYGAVGYGLLSYPEWGLHQLRPDDVLEWTRSWFTRDNAVLWITGEQIPAGLRLRLPEGRRMPVPLATSALPVTPAYFVNGANKVVFDAVVRRGGAATVFSTVLERELYRSLRQEGGYSYTATTAYDPRGDGYATVTALADALPDKQGAALGGFVDVLAKLRLGRIETADVAAAKAKREESFDHPDIAAARLPSYAMNLLTGEPNRSLDEVRADLRAVTEQDVHAVAVEAMSTALLQVPVRHSADWAGFTEAPVWSAAAVAGSSYRSREEPNTAMVIGEQGASLVQPEGVVTVRFDACAAKLSWPDGGVQLIGTDAMVLRLEPTIYAIDPAAIAYVDARVPPQSVVRMPAREPREIPQPRPAPAAPAREKGSVLETFTFVVLSVAVCVLLPLALILTLAIASYEQARGGDWGVVGGFWCFTIVVLLPWSVLLQRVYRRRAARAAVASGNG